jgi:hypothetical protein
MRQVLLCKSRGYGRQTDPVVDTDRTSGNRRAYETLPIRASDPIGSKLLVAGVAEVHQFPDRVVLVGLDQLTTAMP